MRDGKPTKRPIDPTTGEAASATDPDTWGSLQAALEGLETYDVDGIGFVFHESDPFVGVDLDNCRDADDETVESWASSIITLLGSYTERSPSGTGFHILLEGDVPGDRNRKGDIEIYDTARYFTVTGDWVETSPRSIGRRPKSLQEIYQQHLGETTRENIQPQLDTSDHTDNDDDPPSSPTHDIDLDDQELIERARSAANGDAFDALWHGSTAGYDSHSEADMALACHLAFWTAGDGSWMDALFRESGLMRVKWDEPHYADGTTYGQKTIERALTTVTTYYDPDQTTPETLPTVDELFDAVEANKASHRESDRGNTAATTATTNDEETRPADALRNEAVETDSATGPAETTEPPPAAAAQPSTEVSDIATVIADQQAAIDDLAQQLTAQQQTIDELRATIETIQTHFDQRTQEQTPDDTAATGNEDRD